MKKVLLALVVITVVFSSLFIPASGAENLCDKLSVVSVFHNLYVTYENPDIDIGGVLEREVKLGELYSPSTIIAASDLIYVENPNKYTLVKPPKRDPFDTTAPLPVQAPFGQYVCVPRNEYFDFVKKHFEVSDNLLNELQNFKVKNYTTEYSVNGTPIYNPADDTFIVPALADRDTTIQKNTIRQFVGYVENGSYYDVYLKHSKIENDFMKYTVAYNNSAIKYISNIKVNAVPQNLIKSGDIVPDKPLNPTPPESSPESTTEKVEPAESEPVSSNIDSIASTEVVAELSDIDDSSEEDSSSVSEDVLEKENLPANKKKELTNYMPFIIIGILVVLTVAAILWYFLFYKKIINNTDKEQTNETDS